MPDEPFDQFTVPAQPFAVKTKVLGAQTTFGLGAVIVGADGWVTICNPATVELATLVQLPTVQVADIEYVPTVESVKLVPDEPFDQFTVPAQPLAVKVSVLGAHTTFGLGAVIVGELGTELSILTKVVAVAVQPLFPVTVTV